MGLWNFISQGVKNNIARRDAGSSTEYQNAFNQGNKSIDQTQQNVNQYTGNQGYQNSLAQAGQGAGLLANQAVGTATNAARNAGMSKAQAAQMGVQSANNAYANAFQNQQANAMNMGQNAISAQQGVTSAQQAQAGQAASEKQNISNRATGNDPLNRITSAASTLSGAFTGKKM